MAYEAATYWEDRLSSDYSLTGVGHKSFSTYYNRWLYKRKRKTIEVALRGFGLKGKNVLDIGSGTGFFVKWYLAQGALVEGVDISPTAVRHLTSNFPATPFYCADFTGEEFTPSGVYNIINAWDVLYHQVSEDAFLNFLGRVPSLLASNGLFLATDALGGVSDKKVAPHVTFRSAATYKAILEPQGFRLLHFLPLYEIMNRTFLPRRVPNAVYDLLAPLLYFFDNQQRGLSKDNLALGVWQKQNV